MTIIPRWSSNWSCWGLGLWLTIGGSCGDGKCRPWLLAVHVGPLVGLLMWGKHERSCPVMQMWVRGDVEPTEEELVALARRVVRPLTREHV